MEWMHTICCQRSIKHRQKAYEYNQKWDEFFKQNQGNCTQEEIIEYMNQIMNEIYGQ